MSHRQWIGLSGVVCLFLILITIFFWKINSDAVVILSVFFFFSVVFWGKFLENFGKSIVITIVAGGSFLRMLILPFISEFVHISSYIDIKDPQFSRYIIKAALLLAYENVIVYYLLNRMYKKCNTIANINIQSIENLHKVTYILTGLLLLAYFIILFWIAPEIKFYFTNLSSVSSYSLNKVYMKTAIRNRLGYVYWLIKYLLDLLNYWLPGILGIVIAKKFRRPFNDLLCMVLVLFLLNCVSSEAYISYVSALSVIILLLIREKDFLLSNKFFLAIGGISVFVMLIIGLQIKTGQEIIVPLLNAYFPNIPNTCYALAIKNHFNYIFYDFLHAIPFVQGFFTKLPYGLADFQTLTNRTDQIIPMVGQGYVYFGFWFAPLLSYISVFFACKIEKKIMESSTWFEMYIYLLLTCFTSISIYMYNFSILITGVVMLVPALCLMKFGEKIRFKIYV